MLHSENILIEKMQKSDFNEVVILLTDSFETNPAYSLIFNETGNLREGLLWLFRANLFLLNRRETLTNVVREKASGPIIGTFSIVPPGGAKIGLTDYLHIGLPGFIKKFGFHTLSKMLKMDAYNKELLNQSMQTKTYYYLNMMVIKEEYRGKGLGSYVIRKGLQELSEKERTCHVMGLTTQLPENVIFYSKLGFEKLDEGIADFKGNHYYNCNMKFNL